MYLIPISIVFAVGQSLEGMLLTPWLVGDKIGLRPSVAVVFAVLAVPLASVIMVFLRHIHDVYQDSTFYTAEKK